MPFEVYRWWGLEFVELNLETFTKINYFTCYFPLVNQLALYQWNTSFLLFMLQDPNFPGGKADHYPEAEAEWVIVSLD